VSVSRAAFLGFTAIFEKGPKRNDRSTVVGAAIYSCQIGADFGFKIFCEILYKLGELDGEIERIEASTNHFRRKGHIGVNNAFNPCFETLRVQGDGCFVRYDVSQKSCGGGLRRIAHFAKFGPQMGSCVSPAQRLPH